MLFSVFKLLLKISLQPSNLTFLSVVCSLFSFFQQTIVGGASANQDNKESDQLYSAAILGDVTKIESLLSLGFPVDSRDVTNRTPLMIAALYGELQAVKCLVGKGASPSLEDNDGWNSLHFASLSDNTDIELLLLTHGPDIDSTTADGVTPLMIAADNDKLQAVKCLLGKGASPSLENNNGCNSLHFASKSGNPDIIELLLLAHGHDIDSTTGQGVTPLMIGAGKGKLQAVTLLIGKGASPSLEDNNGWNSLHYASRSDNTDIIELLLLTHGPDIDSTTAKGSTPLMIASLYCKLQAVTFLIGKGASSSLEDNKGRNSLHWASFNGNTVIIDTLLSYGVDIESQTKFGETPLMIARRRGHTEAVTYLLSKGAKSD